MEQDKRAVEIADMQAHIFCLAQLKWDVSAKDCVAIFKKHDLLGFIFDCYDLLVCGSYDYAICEMEEILKAHGENICFDNYKTPKPVKLVVGQVSEEQKNFVAASIMRYMLMDYAEEKGISFEDALFLYAESSAYEALFDFKTGIWREGPLRQRFIFEEALQNAAKAES